MSLMDFISKVQSKVILDSKIYGIPAEYLRRLENENGEETGILTCSLNVSPQKQFSTLEKKNEFIGVRICIIWARTDDLKFNGVPFLPIVGDLIRFTIDGQLYEYQVSLNTNNKTQLNIGQNDIYQFEDGVDKIICIFTNRNN